MCTSSVARVTACQWTSSAGTARRHTILRTLACCRKWPLCFGFNAFEKVLYADCSTLEALLGSKAISRLQEVCVGAEPAIKIMSSQGLGNRDRDINAAQRVGDNLYCHESMAFIPHTAWGHPPNYQTLPCWTVGHI